MKNTKKKISPITITILSLAVIGVVFASFLIAHLTKPDNPDVETSLPVGDLQDYEFPDFEPIWGQVAFPGEYNKEKDVLVDYAYSDKYFEIDSTIYNPSLSTMSLCLELSAWASYETDVWAEKTRNARKLLDEIGFEDFAQNDFWSDSPSTESIGVVAAHKVLGDSTLIALPVRGGKYYNEWGSNVNVGTAGEHTGFAEGRDNVIRFLEDYITGHNITGRVKIWVVGYSRGGAVANLVAGYLNENELPNGATLAFEDLYCYVFEPPQGSIVELAGSDADHSNIHNIVNPNDLVTMVAPVDWDFTRYNSTSRLLPTITTAEFESALAVMLEEYEEILAGVEIPDADAAVYNVSEYAKRIDVNVNPLNFLPGGDPMVDIQIVDDTSQTMNEVLTRFITAFAGSLDGREEYNSALEADLIYLLDQLMGYETGFEMDAILVSVMEVMTADGGENLKYVLAPVFSLNGNSTEERTEQVVARLHEVLPQPEGFTDLYGSAATLIKAAGNLLVNHPDELLDIALAFTNSKVMQSHYEEITLAWVRAGDPHYTDTPYTMAVPETLRTVRVNCPVDVEIFDSEGNLVASMIDGIATTNNAVVGCAMNEDGEIIIHLPADAEYNIVTTATGDGGVNITLSEYNLVHSKVTRVQNYANIPVVVGDVLTLVAPNLIEEEYTDEEQQGSTAEYHLSDNSGETILCQSEARGSDIEYYGVSVHTNNSFGAVNGGGQYLDGTFAMVEAQPVVGGEFVGWYIGDELVSTDSAYRFAVNENTSLTAHFSEVPLYALTFGTSGEGNISNADYSYSAGSKVQLSAEATEGYEFDHWATTSGTIEDASNAQTVFIVSESNATITAVFRIKTCSVCHEELTHGETHIAGCGVGEHYSCDGDDHQKLDCGHYACNGDDHGMLSCGHYACESGDHGTLTCGHYACESGEHGELSCGHYNCDSGEHGELSCGHYACDSGDHETLSCGHYACDSGNHGSLSCGHYACESGDHGTLTCGHYACDSGEHGRLTCGHYACESGEHGELSCGHYACESGDHGTLTCGHYACDSGEHGRLTCGHYACESGEHGELSCGHYACDSGDHGTLTCGHYACESGEHGELSCGHYACESGEHGELSCGHYDCDSGEHGELSCGHYACDSGDHGNLSCGHYACESGDHGELSCGHYACESGDHGELSCGHYACGSGNHGNLTCGHYACDSGDHEALSCGHYACDSGNHGSLSCGHYACESGDHGTLTCRHYACDSGDHGELSCGHYACDSSDHGELSCGHYACDSGDHGSLSCGHYACESGDHTTICDVTGCGQYLCDGHTHNDLCGVCQQPGSHQLDCGHYSCDETVSGMDHDMQSCGHYGCEAGDHTAGACGTDGHYSCSGAHTSASCGTSGHYVCDNKDHTAASCGTSNHYSCDGNLHTMEHACGRGHYTCDGTAGTAHKSLECGHYACDSGEHDELTCGHFACEEGDHTTKQACGHLACAEGNHSVASCKSDGHYACDNLNHSTAECGEHFICDEADHSAASCGNGGHFVCDDADHTTICSVVDCGKPLCDGHTHANVCEKCQTENVAHELVCGHFSCEVDASEHGAADCGTSGHYKCNAADHSKAVCGTHYVCAGGEHDVASCGADEHYVCDGISHGTASCGTTGHYTCDGADHGTASCNTSGHYVCDDDEHGKAECGTHNVCEGGDHGTASCNISGHYVCDGADHAALCSVAGCGKPLCNGHTHTDVCEKCQTENAAHELVCGHYSCEVDASSHGAADCGTDGHYKCDGGDHSLYGEYDWDSCGHYKCDESASGLNHERLAEGCEHFYCDSSAESMDHSYCSYCGHSVCSSELPDGITHGEGTGSCYEWAYSVCKNCGVNTGDAGAHYAVCYGLTGHYTCDSDGLDHSAYECGSHFKCSDSDTETEHSQCTGCNYPLCYDGYDHTTCTYCGKRKCEDESEHGDGVCDSET